MKTILGSIGFALLRAFFRILLSKEVRAVLWDAVDHAESVESTGERKAVAALRYLYEHGPPVLVTRSKSELRTLLELVLDGVI